RILDVLKRWPIVVRQIRRVFGGGNPPGFRLVEMQMVRMVARHIRRAHKGMSHRTASGNYWVPIFIGEKADPGPCNKQESGGENCRGAYRLPQTALIDGNVGAGQRKDHQRG